MSSFEKSVNPSSPNSPQKSFRVFSPANLVSIYTTLRILQTMRSQLGLEAMLEYIGKYILLVERDNPQLKLAVTQALKLMSVEKMYRDAAGDDEK